MNQRSNRTLRIIFYILLITASIFIFVFLKVIRPEINKTDPAEFLDNTPPYVQVRKSPDYPQSLPVAQGVLLSQEQDLLEIGTGNIQIAARVDSTTGKREITVDYDGPILAVRTSSFTIVFQDITLLPAPTDGVAIIDQIVVEGDLPVAGQKQFELKVWGEKKGPIIEAELIVFRLLS